MDSQGNVYVAAYMQQPPSQLFYDMIIYKFSPAGEELWRTQWGCPRLEAVHGLAIQEGVAFLAGNTSSYGKGNNDVLVIKADGQNGQFPPPGE